MSHPRRRRGREHPLIELLSSMRFAVALLTVLGIACVIGTVLPQNRTQQDYVFEFGVFWTKVFELLGLYDVYASAWFVAILVFLVLSTALCLWRHTPQFLREARSFRLTVSEKSLSLMRLNRTLSRPVDADIGERYLRAQGFRTKRLTGDGVTLVAGKKGSLNKLGYVSAHLALIVICLGGLLDSNLPLKFNIFTGRVQPDKTARYDEEFAPASRLSADNLSFRGDVTLVEGQTTNAIFVHTGDNAYVLQELPFTLKLDRFRLEFYDNGMPKDYISEVTVRDADGQTKSATIRVNRPLRLGGVSIYQSGFGDGGSPLTFDVWSPLDPTAAAQSMDARSLSEMSFDWGEEKYRISFSEFKAHNVQKESADERSGGVLTRLRSVKESDDTRDLGPSITWSLRDSAGKTRMFMNYLLPQNRDGSAHYFYGVREPGDDRFKWLSLPADPEGSLKTFMLLREAMNDEAAVDEAVKRTEAGFPPAERQKMTRLSRQLLRLFAARGYEGLDEVVRKTVPVAEQRAAGALFYQNLAYTADRLLDIVLEKRGETWESNRSRADFVLAALEGMTAMHHYPAPILLQLTDFREVAASNLQMTRAPGEKWVWFGSLLLILGALFMFYLREQRVWLRITPERAVFAMSGGRRSEEPRADFARHCRNLETLIKEIDHERSSSPA